MNKRYLSKLILAFVLIQSSFAFSQNRPGRYPEPGNGGQNGHGGGAPGPIRPDPGYGPGRGHGPGPGPIRPDPGYGPGHGPGPGPIRPGPRPEPRPYPRPDPRPYPNPQPRPIPPPNYSGEASVQFNGVTRRVGGEWWRVGFNRSTTIDYVQLNIWSAGARVYEAYAITESNRRIPLDDLTYYGTLYSGASVSSSVRTYERIIALDFRVESMGGYADINVRVSSDEGTPYIYSTRY